MKRILMNIEEEICTTCVLTVAGLVIVQAGFGGYPLLVKRFSQVDSKNLQIVCLVLGDKVRRGSYVSVRSARPSVLSLEDYIAFCLEYEISLAALCLIFCTFHGAQALEFYGSCEHHFVCIRWFGTREVQTKISDRQYKQYRR